MQLKQLLKKINLMNLKNGITNFLIFVKTNIYEKRKSN